MVETAGLLVPYTLLFISLYFEVFLLIAFLEMRLGGIRMRLAAPAVLPTVTIIVPCYNEERGIEETIHSLLALDYPKDKFEVLVVDDGSTDKTLELARALEGPQVRVLTKENGGKHSAMNLGLSTITTDLVGCLDADSVVNTDALMKIVPAFSDERVGAVTPGIHVREPKSLLQHLQLVEYRISIFNRFMLSSLGAAFITPGPFSILRTSVVKELGGWRHAHSTEDMEMALRFQEAGHLIANAPQAIVYTSVPNSIRHLLRQRIRWTYGFLRNLSDYRHMLWNSKYGNLGLLVLPTALISIGTALYFALRMTFYGISSIHHELVKVKFAGISEPRFVFDSFFINTSTVLFLVYASILCVIAFIWIGSYLGTGRRTPPAATPFFLLFYGFLAPFWLGAALFRASFRTGVRWK